MKRWLPVVVILAILFVPGFVLPRFGADAVTASVAVQPEVLFELEFGHFTFPITNTLLTTWIVMILIVLFAFLATRKMELVPGGLQNVMELIVEMWDGLGQSVAGERSRKFLPIVLTIFIFVLFSNWLGLVPGFGPIGIIAVDQKHPAPQGIATFDLSHAWEEFLGPKHGAGEHAGVLAPFVRSPSTDINTTLALALISVIMTQIFGMQALGVVKYWFARFFMIGKFVDFFRSLLKGKPNFGALVFG
ncbi:MAG: FoF1 ATP synthase subunit a, partial [Chloroflexota bacterium]